MSGYWFCLLLATSTLSVANSGPLDSEDNKNCIPPSIKIQSSDDVTYFIVNMIVELPCIASGNGSLIYTWTKSGHVLNLNEPDLRDRIAIGPGTGTLNIQAKETDEGIYQCFVTSTCGTSVSKKVVLALARMVPFPKPHTPTDVKGVLGSSLKLDCKPPESIPQPRISWMLINPKNVEATHNDTGQRSVTLDSRVTMDYDGNLYITSLRKEDEQGSKIYVCQADNDKTRSTNIGEDKKIIALGMSASNRGVDLMWHSNNQSMVLVDDDARFKCIFSGHPEPSISWKRLTGGDLDKTRMLYDGNELIIKGVQHKDEGEYQCTGRNALSQGFKSHTFKLIVQAAPQWKSQPQKMSVGVGESASLQCDAIGVPSPNVQWFINGKPYADVPANSHRVLKENTLFFTNLEREDSQVIQCNASNIHGSIWSDVYLYVEGTKPVIKNKSLNKLAAAEQQNLLVSCHVLGKPKPRVIWYKGGQQLVHQKYQITQDGDLIIQNTEKKDSGTYRCFAENRFGEDEVDREVIIRDRTRIESKPIDDQVDYTNSVTFTCGATTDPMESDNLKIRWLKDGEMLKPSDRIIIHDNSLTIRETNSKDTAAYTCLADNGLDNDTATATLKVKAVPDPPYNISVEECLTKQASIKWIFEEKMRNFDTMIKFIVEYMTEYKPDVWIVATSQPHPAVMAKVDLSPYAKYRFRVKAVNMMGISEPSEPTYSWCETAMSIPDKNPDSVRTDESSTGYLIVKWKPMDQIDLNGPNFRYEIEYQEQGTNISKSLYVNDFQVGEERIPVNNVYRPYNIKVRAINQIGKAMMSPETVVGYSGEAPPLVVPENFELDPDVNVTATSAGFRWDPVDTSQDLIRGEFSGYKIRFWKAGERDTTLNEHIVHSDESNNNRGRRHSKDGKIRGIVASLPSYSEVETDVVVINKNFESNGSNIVNFSTPEGVPGRVEYLEALNRGSHHFLIQWEKPKEQNGVIIGYQVSYRKINKLDFEDEVIAFDDIDPESNRATLKHLQPDSQYRIYIRAKTGKGLGKDYFIDVRTISIVSAVALPVIKNVSAGTSYANVTWDIIPTEKGSRHGQLYYIDYKKKNSDKWQRFNEPVEDQFWGQVKKLEPGTQYQVRVQSVTHGNELGPPSEPFMFKTAGSSAARASFPMPVWFIAMMVAIILLILLLIIICIIKRNRGDNYPVQEKERLRGAYNDDNPDHFNGFAKGDENGVGGSFDRDAEKVPLDEDVDSLDYGDDDASKFNEDGSFIGQYGPGEKANETTNASSIV